MEFIESRVIGFGLVDGVVMGFVIILESKSWIYVLIDEGVVEGVWLVLDGWNFKIVGYEGGNFIVFIIFEDVFLGGKIVSIEIFGLVMSLIYLDSID